MNEKKIYIIGEVGPNHNGRLETALEMIEKMAAVGVDCVKFQLTNPYKLYSEDSFKASYQQKNDKAKGAREMSLSYQLKPEAHIKLFHKCKECGVDYICTAFDLESLIFLDQNIDMPYYKIASGEIFSLDIIKYISQKHKPIILSTGMATYEEIENSIKLFNCNFPKDITILHCISNYPANFDEVNLRNIITLKNRFNCNIGFSDHTIGNDCAIASVAMGVTMIEKHVTLDKNSNGPDHKASIDIAELKSLVSSIRNVEKALGSYERTFSDSQREISRVARKSIVTTKALKAGHVITEEDICFKRPGTGILPIELDKVIGHRMLVDLEADRVIHLELID